MISLAGIPPTEVVTTPLLIELTVTPNRRSLTCFAITAERAPTPLLGNPGLPLMKVLMISNPAGAAIFVRSVR